jgi:glutathione S-transferase
MALTIYGSARSRTMRVLWAAEELGLEFDHVPLTWDDPKLKSPEFLTIHPAGQIPTIVDDGFALSESLAILLYLTKKYGGTGPEPLYPERLEDEADVWRWVIWAQGGLEPWVMRDVRLTALRNAVGSAPAEEVARGLAVLEAALTKRAWLVGKHFTVADMSVAGVLSPSRADALDLSPYPALRDWLARCYARPACVRTRKTFA